MRLNWITLIIFLLATSCGGQGIDVVTEIQKKEAKPARSGMQRKDYMPGEILVKFKDGTDGQAIETITNRLHLKCIRVVSRPNLYLMKITDGSSVEQVMESLKKYEEVKYSEPNYVRTFR